MGHPREVLSNENIFRFIPLAGREREAEIGRTTAKDFHLVLLQLSSLLDLSGAALFLLAVPIVNHRRLRRD
jgi:hypothetical protein